jgi:hypothetical protein
MTLNNTAPSSEGISLKEYINDKFDNLEKSIDSRFESITQTTNSALSAADKATLKAENAVEKRFESVNEFRATLSDQTRSFLTRSEFNAKWESIEKNRKDVTTLIIAILGIIISIVSLISGVL